MKISSHLYIVIVDSGLHGIHIFRRISHFNVTGEIGKSVAAGHFYLCLALLTRFGGYQYDSGIGTRTIDSSGGSVFQDFHAFNVIRIQVGIFFARDTVNDIKWRASSTDGTNTTNGHIGGFSRSTGSRGYIHTCYTSLQHFYRVIVITLVYIFHLYFTDGSCH